MVIATALGWHDLPSILLAVVLAFFFGYLLTIRPLLAGGLPFRRAARTATAWTRSRSESWSSSTTCCCSSSPAPWRPGSRPAVLGQPRGVAARRVRRDAAGQSLAHLWRARPCRCQLAPLSLSDAAAVPRRVVGAVKVNGLRSDDGATGRVAPSVVSLRPFGRSGGSAPSAAPLGGSCPCASRDHVASRFRPHC